MNEFIMTAMEIIGTIAFSISGALIGVSYGLDIFGVVFLGVITSVGGGCYGMLLLEIFLR